MRKYKRERAGDAAWALIIGTAITYEFMFEDLLSMATQRWVRRHPVATRLLIVAVAGHLGVMLPARLDIFNADNQLHRIIVELANRRKGAKSIGSLDDYGVDCSRLFIAARGETGSGNHHHDDYRRSDHLYR